MIRKIKKILSKLKRKVKKNIFLKYNTFHEYQIDIKVDYEWIGNDYGGFPAYLKCLNDKSIVFSFGIGEDISFDTNLYSRCQCKLFLFDPTPRSISYINSQNLNTNFHFLPIGIGPKSGKYDFYFPKNPNNVSGSIMTQKNVSNESRISVQIKSWEDICCDLKISNIDILKIDIEGSEYEIIDDILSSKIRVNQILIEFHSRYFDNGDKMTINAINKIKSKGYKLFSISDSMEEFGFIKNIL
jgi:FkbM family methyltransferase